MRSKENADHIIAYYHYLPEEIAELSENEKRSELPMAYQVKKDHVILTSEVAKLHLDTLRYPDVFRDVNTAIKLFQQDLGDKPTGKITIGQLYILGKRADFVRTSGTSIKPLNTSFYSTDDISLGYASVQGTTIILDDRMAYPINSIEIACIKSSMTCEEKVINIHDKGSLESTMLDFGSTIFVSLNESDYRVIDWGQEEIIAKPKGAASSCRNSTLTLNFATKEFVMTTTNRNTDREECKMWKLERPRISKIVEGYKPIGQREQEKREERKKLLYSGHQKELDAIFKIFEQAAGQN